MCIAYEAKRCLDSEFAVQLQERGRRRMHWSRARVVRDVCDGRRRRHDVRSFQTKVTQLVERGCPVARRIGGDLDATRCASALWLIFLFFVVRAVTRLLGRIHRATATCRCVFAVPADYRRRGSYGAATKRNPTGDKHRNELMEFGRVRHVHFSESTKGPSCRQSLILGYLIGQDAALGEFS